MPTLQSPFQTAPGSSFPSRGALDAVGRDTVYRTLAPEYMALSRSANSNVARGLSESEVENIRVRECVSGSTLLSHADTETNAPSRIYVRYAERPTLLANVTPPVPAEPTNPFVDSSSLDPLPFYDFEDEILPRSPALDASPEEQEIFYRITTPYNVTAFESDLKQYNILERFPLLTRYLQQGFPLGRMPQIKRTTIIPNHPSVAQHSDIIMEFITEEEKARRMSGPFSQATMERILGGPFISVPLIVAESDQGPDKPAKYRICSHASKGGFDQDGDWVESINSNVEKEKFPTTFDTASQVAHWVSFLYIFFSIHTWGWHTDNE